ncbi:acetyl-CoA carboxylase biotin carboxyl carrier protein [Saccharothrix syringae]|uniref:acetyl-CoA carboxylase biotin carboxyl carrier protein n=1 Tax=Saccharothrix syringae TaxID=103733 RepID=UPI000B15CF58|nr:biotin/lipoyl-containing protein [Saccharothrix syringae]
MTQGVITDNGHELFNGLTERLDGHRALLEETRRSVVRLLADVPTAPKRLRVQAGDVVVEVEWDDAGQPVTVVAAGAPAAPEPPAPEGEYLTSPTVGVFYRAPQPGAPPFVAEGDRVRPGQQVGIVEAMKLMIPVEADRAGLVARALAADGETVEYGTRLFELAPPDRTAG